MVYNYMTIEYQYLALGSHIGELQSGSIAFLKNNQ